MSNDFQPFVEIEFEVLFSCAAEETAAPAATTAMGDGLTDGAAGGEEEEIDVWVYLGYDGEVDVEVEV